jgi:hypothetical protein
MKKQILTSLTLIGSFLTVNAQIYTPNATIQGSSINTNIGIGTTSPTNALTVQKVSGGTGFSGTNGTGGVRVNWSTGFGVALDAWDGNTPRWGITKFNGNTPTVILEGQYNSNDVYFNSGGNIGIGTTSPTNALTVQKVSGGTGFSGTNGTGGVRVNWSTGFGVALDAWDGNTPRWGITKFNGNTPTVILEGQYNSNDVYFNSGGNIGIGTTSAKYKLDVCGTIRANEVKVDLTGICVPDFVFKKDYKLMSLKELEKFVTTKQHLPEIASEKEMIEDGLNMKEFQMKLLQKMEEMTLYIIEQNKKNEKQEQELKILKAEIKKIKSNKR